MLGKRRKTATLGQSFVCTRNLFSPLWRKIDSQLTTRDMHPTRLNIPPKNWDFSQHYFPPSSKEMLHIVHHVHSLDDSIPSVSVWTHKEDVYFNSIQFIDHFYSLHPELEFWTYLISNNDHTENFWLFGHFYGCKNGHLGINGTMPTPLAAIQDLASAQMPDHVVTSRFYFR